MAQVSFMDALAGATPKASSPFLTALASAPPPKAPSNSAPTDTSWLQRLDALGAGFNKGVAQLAGLPGDVALNAENLGKSAIEAGMLSAGKLPPTWLDPVDSSKNRAAVARMPLTSPWFEQKLNSLVGRDVTDAPQPNDPLSRTLAFAGSLGPGLLSGNPMESTDARLQEGAMQNLGKIPGAQVPGLMPGRLVSMLAPGLTRAQDKAATEGRKLGMRLTPGQATGSKPLQQAEAWAQSHPWTSGPFARLARGNQEALNRVAASSIGENSPSVDADTLSDAARRTGDIFEAIRNSKMGLPVEPQETENFLGNLEGETEGLLPNDASIRSHPLVRTLQGLMDRAAGRAADRKAFFSDFEKATKPNPNDPAQRLLGGYSVEIVPDPFDESTAHIHMLEGPKEGGPGTALALRKIMSLADEHGVPMTTDAQPVGRQLIPRQQLIDHYKQAGFRPLEEDDGLTPLPMARQPQVTAKQLGQLSSKLGRAAYKQMSGQSGDRDLGQALYQVKDHVDDLLERHLTGEGKAAYSKARGEYRNLMHLVTRQNVVNPSTGNVNGVALAARLQKADRPGFLYGRNTSPLYSAARFAQAFKPIVGDSGTATRSGNPLEWLYGIPLNVGARMYVSPLGQKMGIAAIKGGAHAPGAARRVSTAALRHFPLLPALALSQ